MGKCRNCFTKIEGNGYCKKCAEYVMLSNVEKINKIKEILFHYPHDHPERVKYEKVIEALSACN